MSARCRDVGSAPGRSLPGTGTRFALVLAVVAAFTLAPVRPVLADHDDDRGHERDAGHRRDQNRDHGRREDYRRYHVYAPPPVYYPREASPGISLFLPFEIR